MTEPAEALAKLISRYATNPESGLARNALDRVGRELVEIMLVARILEGPG
jgi:hypothetical protein